MTMSDMSALEALAAADTTAAAGAPAPSPSTAPAVYAGGDVEVTTVADVNVGWLSTGARFVEVAFLRAGDRALVTPAEVDRLTGLGVIRDPATGEAPQQAADTLDAATLAALSAGDVETWVEAHPDQADAVLALERDGKNRKTVVGPLEALIEARAAE